MEYPRYRIVFDRAAKAVQLDDGSIDILAYNPKTDSLERAMELTRHFFLDTDDADVVGEEAFEAFGSRQRRTR